MTCYKYVSGASALRILATGSLYFASPDELNDSLEANFDFADVSRFARVFNTTFDELALRRGYAGDLSYPAEPPEGLQPVNEEENANFRLGCRQVGIFSAAPRPDNQPMWAYYSNNGQGMCFRLEWSQEIINEHNLFPTKVTYTTEPRVHNRADDLRDLLLEVDQQNPAWTMAQLARFSMTEEFRRRWGIRSTARAVSMKHADWQHEEEIRILAPQSGPKTLLREVLREAYFVRSDATEWGSFIMLLHRLYPDVSLADVSFNHTAPFVTIRSLKLGER
jgi:hypothetical protein